MEATQRQKAYIAYLIHRNQSEYAWMKQVMDSLKYEYIDDRQIQVERMLNGMTSQEADYFIKSFSGQRGYHPMTARNIINKYIKI